MPCEATVFARAGLVGNPSDGYFGKTMSISVRDFAAKVSLYESAEMQIVPSAQDQSSYKSMRELVADVKANGYYGGVRLMKAAVRKFADYCVANDIEIEDKNFALRYRSTIPRRLGMAGSSALVTATMRCLMEYYDVDIAKPLLPNLILSVETEELGISAGLQDRVIQVYTGCVYMDFSKEHFERQGHGVYTEVDPRVLPPLFIAYRKDLGEGSEVFHNNVRQRWLDGDPEVRQAMVDFASYAEEAYALILAGRAAEIGGCMDQNFRRRRSVFNLDPRNIDMVERAWAVGAHATFAGSGGAIVGTYEDEAMYGRLVDKMAEGGIAVFKPHVEA